MWFSLGGSKGGDKVAYFKCADLCKIKMEGGLGVKDTRLVNLALLSKWRWRVLLNVPLLLIYICVVRYHSQGFGSPLGVGRKTL